MRKQLATYMPLNYLEVRLGWCLFPHGGFGFVWRLLEECDDVVALLPQNHVVVIGIDHDTVCAGVVGTAIQHSTSCASRRAAGTISAVPDCTTNHDSTERISAQFLFYHDHNFTRSKGNLRFQRLVPLFVPIGVCVTTHDDGTASDVTICMWRHNQQATNHELNGKPWFSFPK